MEIKPTPKHYYTSDLPQSESRIYIDGVCLHRRMHRRGNVADTAMSFPSAINHRIRFLYKYAFVVDERHVGYFTCSNT